MMPPLHVIQRQAAGGVTILELSGHLVFDEGARVFKEQVTALVAAGQKYLLVDLKNITYIDSGGVGALVGMYLHALRRGGQLKLLCPSERASHVLGIAQLLKIFEVFDNEEKAIRTFGKSSTDPTSPRPHGVAG